jgi:archaellum component FlaC
MTSCIENAKVTNQKINEDLQALRDENRNLKTNLKRVKEMMDKGTQRN